MRWLPFSQKQKCVESVVRVCCLTLLVFGCVSMTFNKKAFVAKNRTDALIAT